MKVLILKPRLDIPFKFRGTPPPKAHEQLPEIRQHWENFVNKLEQQHKDKGDEVIVLEKPFLELTLHDVNKTNADISYIPHNDKKRFGGDHRCKYYMQTVFPWLFTIDENGWGGDAAYRDIAPCKFDFDFGEAFREFQERIFTGETKFEQPGGDYDFDKLGEFILVPLQVPHDLTIQYHSPISVQQYVQKISAWAKESNTNVVFKPHPLDRGWYNNMKKESFELGQDNVTWIDNVPIHKMLKACKACYVINSGVGLEAMLHQIPVVAFGRADYDSSVIKGEINDLTKTWKDVSISNNPGMINRYMRFYNYFINYVCFDSRIK
jgi:hypothetical protein